MNVYKCLNEITEYIEEHVEEKIDYNKLAKIIGTNSYTMQRIFALLTNVTLADYIRKRRLSLAAYDLYSKQADIVDIAIKYGYENPTSFSRAFRNFHGLKPSEVKKGNLHFSNFSRIIFDEKEQVEVNMHYEIKELPEFVLYGKGIKTDEIKVKKDAPAFFRKMKKEYNKYGDIDYGMIIYEDRFNNHTFEYWVLWNKDIKEFQKVIIPKSKWLIFHIPNTNAKDIQKVSEDFYCNFIPSNKYNIRPIPELEYYHDGVTDFLVPIED